MGPSAQPGARGTGWPIALRAQLNRAMVGCILFVGLPAIALAEAVRTGAGRRVALAAVRLAARVSGVRIEVGGGDTLAPGRTYVFVPNHRSHLDIVAMLLARPDARFVGAQELFRIPLLASAMRALGTVPVDRRDRRRSTDQFESLRAEDGPSEIVVFAEGGIVPIGEEWRFKTGAFVLALQREADLVPVAIRGARDVAPPERRLLVRPGLVTVDLLPPVPTVGLGLGDRKGLRTEVEGAVRAALT